MEFKQVQQAYLDATKETEEKRYEIDEKIDKKAQLIAKKEAEIKRIQNQIDKLESDRYSKVGFVSWIDGLVEPIAKHFEKEFGLEYKIYGPFGMRGQTSIYWYERDEEGEEKTRKSLTVVPIQLRESLIGYETGFEKDGSTPATYHSNDPNGFRKEVKALPESFDEIINCIHHWK